VFCLPAVSQSADTACVPVTFQTASSGANPHSSGPFVVEGWGDVPASCYSEAGATCVLHICSSNFQVTAITDDAWAFTVSVEGGSIPPHNWTTVSGGEHFQGPEMLDTDQYDEALEYGEFSQNLLFWQLHFGFLFRIRCSVSVCVCVYVCVCCVCVYIIYTYIYIHMYIYIHIHM
jgi:hypothetical protein